MDAQNGALFFDSDIDDKKYQAKIVSMEARAILFGNNVIAGNAAIQKSFDRLANSIGNGRLSKSIDTVDSRIETFVNNAIANTGRVGAGFTDLGSAINSSKITNGLNNIDATLERLAKTAANSSRSISGSFSDISNSAGASSDQINDTFSKLQGAIAGYFSLQALKGFGSELINITGQFQQLQVAYTTILGSKRKADTLFAESVDLAKTSPFSLIDVATSSKQLLAYGFDVKDVTSTVKELGNIAAGVSAPLGDIAYLYGTLKTQGRAYAQDIRQFTGRGIPIIAELAKQFNTTETNVNSLVEAGKVGFPEVEKAFKSLTSEGGQFFNLMQEQSKTITGQISNLGDSFDQLLFKLGSDNKNAIGGGIEILSDMIDHYQQIIDVIKELVIIYGSYRAALIVQSAAEIANVAAIGLEAAAYALLREGIEVLNREMILAAATTAAYTAGIAVVATLIYALTANTNAAAAAQDNFNDINKQAAKDTQQQIDKIGSLRRVIADNTNAEVDRIKAVTSLRDIMGDRLKQYTDEEILAGKAETAIKSYTAALLENAKAAAAQGKLQEIQTALLETDAKSQGVDKAYQGIPIRERIKGSIGGLFDGSAYGSQNSAKTAELNKYRQFLKDQQKAILDVYGKEIDDLNVGIDRTNNSKDIQKALAFQKLLKDASANFDALVKTSTGKKDYEAIGKGLSDALDVPNITDAQIAKIKDQQKKLQPILDKYSFKSDLKKDNSAQNDFEKRQAIYGKIGDLEAKRVADSETADEKEVASVKAKYKAILDEIDKYNRTTKGKKIGSSVIARVLGDQNTEVTDVTSKQKLKGVQSDIDAEKQVFDDFEKYKQDVGATEAQKRYGDELKGYTSFVGYLEGMLTGLDGKTDAYSNGLRDILAKEIPKAQNAAAKNAGQIYNKLLIDNQTYQEKRAQLTEVYEAKLAILNKNGRTGEAEVLKQNYQEDLNQLNLNAVKKLDAYKELFNNVTEVNAATSRKDLATLQDFIDKYLDKSSEAYKEIQKLINDTQKALDDRLYDKLSSLGDAFSKIGASVSGLNSEIGALITSLAGTVSSVANIGKLGTSLKDATTSEEKFKISSDLVSTALSGIFNIVGSITSAAKARKEAEQAYYNSVLKQQNDYNLSLNEEIRLRTQLNSNVFTKDYKNIILDGTKALADANAKYLKSLDDLQKGQVKIGQRNTIDGKTLGGSVAGGATAGAAIGALVGGGVLSVPAAAAGAVIGGVVGLIGGLFAKKKKDIFGGLLTEYPELIQKANDGTETFNETLAKTLINNNLVDDATKAMLENTIALNDARQAAVDQINSAITDLAGSLGDDLRNSLVTAFEDGSDAAKAFGDDVSKVIENIIAQFLFNDIFGSEFDKLEADMKSSFGIGGDQNFTDDLVRFYQDAGPLIAQYNAGLQAAKDEGAKYGLNVFGSSSSSSSGISGSIQRTITEDTGTALEGLYRSMYDIEKRSYDVQTNISVTLGQQLVVMNGIAGMQTEIRDNTALTAENTSVLGNIDKSLTSISKGLASSEIPGYGKGLGNV